MFTVEDTNFGVGYFYAHQFGMISGVGGYIGIQTRLSGAPVNDPRGIIFSIFGATGAEPGAGAWAVHSSEVGGDFWSLRMALAWPEGHKFDAIVTRQKVAVDGAYTNKWRGQIRDVTAGTLYTLGNIIVPTSWGNLNPFTVQWTEYYTPINACSDMPRSAVVWERPNLYPGYPQSNYYSTASNPHLQTGTDCTNSAIQDLGTQRYREIMGATS